MKNIQCPFRARFNIVFAFILSLLFFSQVVLAVVWTTVKDPETGKMVTLRKGETLEQYRLEKSTTKIQMPSDRQVESVKKNWVDVTKEEKAKIL